jgi:zinc/manganese transport system substrate-binding protein
MAARMAELDPVHGEGYADRAEQLVRQIEARLPSWRQTVAPVLSYGLVVHTKQWEYLADWLGLQIIGAIEHRPGIVASPRHVSDLINAARQRGRVIVIAATWNHLDASRNAAERMSAPLVVLPAAVGASEGAESYLAMFETICGRLAAAAGSP